MKYSPATPTALLIIDMQRDFCDRQGYAAHAGLDIEQLRTPIPNIQRLLLHARDLGWLVIHTREGHRPDLSDLTPVKQLRAENAGAPIGREGPLGRLLIQGEYGHGIIDELAPLPGEPVVDKPGYSAFIHTDLDLLLRNRGIKQLVLVGVTLEVCVSSTLRNAVDLGYACLIVSDACASSDPALQAAALAMVQVEGGIFGAVCLTQDVIASKDAAL